MHICNLVLAYLFYNSMTNILTLVSISNTANKKIGSILLLNHYKQKIIIKKYYKVDKTILSNR